VRKIARIVGLLALLVFAAVLVLRFSPRPPDSTDPAVFRGDGSTLSYCDAHPDPAGPFLAADDIPVAHTPGCGYETFPMPILGECAEPLTPGAPDLRGLWQATSGMVGHVERIEQCGNRVVISSGGVIHDMRADGTLRSGVNDVSGAACLRIKVAAAFVDGALELRPFGGPVVAVSRKMDGEELVWEYAGKTSRLERICDFPVQAQTGGK